ncbi:MAG: T9SS type A sorting domain-containing protein [Bacteroidia bacterium]
MVDDLSNQKNILLYPNPAREFLNIAISEPQMPEAYTIKLVNMLGQTILNLPVKAEDQISLRGIPEGVYVYQIEENGLLIQSGKLLIHRD